MSRTIVTIIFTGLLWVSCEKWSFASTAAFGGKVIAVKDCPSNQKDCLKQFTVRIGFFEYISWSKFGRHSKVGETITRRVKKIGTACMINGKLVNEKTYANALKPGRWGYFYEDTWLNMYHTPDFLWGEIVAINPNGSMDVRVHFSHIDYHTKTNPPKIVTVKIAGKDTGFRREEVDVNNASAVLKPGSWVQVHPPRKQIISSFTMGSEFDPKELLPQKDGRRGFANDLTCPAVILGYETESPSRVTDVGVSLRVKRYFKEKWETVTLNCRKVSFILDGKQCPVNVACRPGRRAVLGYYRKEKAPHKILVQSKDRAVRGYIKSVKDDSFVVLRSTPERGGKEDTIQIEKGAEFWLDGIFSNAKNTVRERNWVVVYPARERTIIAFPPYEPSLETSKK